MAQPLQARQIEEAAAALYGMNEAKDRIEPSAILRIRLPGNDLASERFKRFARFGNEIREKIVHVASSGRFPNGCGIQRVKKGLTLAPKPWPERAR